jgi:hypothetical protein
MGSRQATAPRAPVPFMSVASPPHPNRPHDSTDRLGGATDAEWFGWSLALTRHELMIGVPRADGGSLGPSSIGRRRGCVVTAVLDDAGTLSTPQRLWGERARGTCRALDRGDWGWIVAGAPVAGAGGASEGAIYLFRRTAATGDARGTLQRWRMSQRISAAVEPNQVPGFGRQRGDPWSVDRRCAAPGIQKQPVQPGSCLVLSPECVQPFDDLAPALGALTGDEGILHGPGIGVVGRELDAELAHMAAGGPVPMDDAGQPVVLQEHLALLGEDEVGSAGRRPAIMSRAWRKIQGLPMQPRATLTPATPHWSSMAKMSSTVQMSPPPNTDPIRAPSRQLLKELPSTGPLIPLLNGAAVHGGPCIAELVRRIEDLPEAVLGSFGVIPARVAASRVHGTRLPRRRSPRRREQHHRGAAGSARRAKRS